MTLTTRLIAQGGIQQLGSSEARLQFTVPGSGPIGLRRLIMDGQDAFDLAGWCGTCSLVFERM